MGKTYRPPPVLIGIGYLILIFVLGFCIYAALVLIDAGVPWWWALLFVPLPVLAIIVCVEIRNVSLRLTDEGVRYQAVGYTLDAPWNQLRLATRAGNTVLLADGGGKRFHRWLMPFYALARVFMPWRADRGVRLMRTVPLYVFEATGPKDELIEAVRRQLPDAAPPS